MITDDIINFALEEDMVFSDITTNGFICKNKLAKAVLIANKPGILCGVDIFTRVFRIINKKCNFQLKKNDCSRLKKNDEILTISGPVYAILSGERTALNFLQYMSGISTITNKFVKSVGNCKPKIYDTRKIIPGYREIVKYAVRCGGGINHRKNLSDMVIIKDNHLKFIKNLTFKINEFRKKNKHILIEIECENIKQVKKALNVNADVIMLDNTNFEDTKKMISFIRKHSIYGYNPEIEISGGVNIKTIKKFAKLDADRISVGIITHSSPILDLTLEIIR
ncbi:MAG: carboxylating nicotinate-nucleotide diphosphorylase [Endomicrobium sp.]|jgi:nicotinate-nucleotide pyrophosphorylase (carboxylating)|nr:carboxylating nicotinate-nucleotide diphosphorylase [Endomicrobium sp.]